MNGISALMEEVPESPLPTFTVKGRSIYIRYLRLYERYFADIDALDDDEIEELKKYHEETKSVVKYYYLDIPLDICMGLHDFDSKYNDKLLGSDWRTYLFDIYADFKSENRSNDQSEASSKAAFAEQTLTAFYSAMDSIFRDGFGTGSKTAEKVVSGIAGLLFGK